LERGRRIDRDRAASGDIDLEQPGDRLVEGIECLVGRDLLLGLALEDVLDREVLVTAVRDRVGPDRRRRGRTGR
jgi:hypothetical protein